MNFITVLSVLFILIGIVLLSLAARQSAKKRVFLQGSLTSSGEIVRFTEVPDGVEKSYFPKVKFSTAEGREIIFQSEMGSNTPVYKIGDTIRVRYSRNQPFNAEIDSFLALWGAALIFGLLGGVFSFVGLGILIGWLPI
jgi:hypothetical protein